MRQLQRATYNGPWGGKNDVIAPEQLQIGQFADSLNTVNIAGRVGPRPGYEKVGTLSAILAAPYSIATKPDFASDAIRVHSPTGKVYFTNSGIIWRCDSDGTNIEEVLDSGGDIEVFAIDHDLEVIYFTNASTPLQIKKYDSLDPGGSVTNTVLVATIPGPVDMDVAPDGRIFWVNNSDNTIMVSTPGVGGESTAPLPGLMIVARRIAVIEESGTVYAYVGSGVAGRIWRAPENDTLLGFYIATGLGSGSPSRITIDTVNEKVYFSSPRTQSIERCNYDGTEREVVLSTGETGVASVAIDPVRYSGYFHVASDLLFKFRLEGATVTAIGKHVWERSIVGTSELIDDIVLFHVFDSADDRDYLVVWFPTQGISFALTGGLTAPVGDLPYMFVQFDRDADPVGFNQSFGGNTFDTDYMGLGLSSHQGGLLMTNGQGAWVFNYVAPGEDADFPNGLIYLRPAGLPTVDWTADTHPTDGTNLDGVYRWKLTYYSTRLGIESPVAIISTPLGVAAPAQGKLEWTNPATNYFEATFPGGVLIDKVRIYRKRDGSGAGGTASPDGIGADDNWYFVAEVDAADEIYYDNVADSGRTTQRAPGYQYPPETAQFLACHKGRAFFEDLAPGVQRIWNSELPNPVTGELGHEYVNEYANAVLDNNRASDHYPTGIQKYGDLLLAFTNRDAFVINADLLEFGELTVRRLPGGAGCANKKCIVETDALAELGGRLIYPNAEGHIYEFAGNESRPISLGIQGVIDTLTKVTWKFAPADYPTLNSWNYASAVLDPQNYWVVFSVFLDAGTVIQVVYDLRTQSWHPWNIQGWTWFGLRQWDGSSGKGKHRLIFVDSAANIFRIADGTDDYGTPIAWHLLTGMLDAGEPTSKKRFADAHWTFKVRSYGGAAAQVTHEAYRDNKAAISKGPVTLGTLPKLVHRLDARADFIQYKLSGTITGTQSRPFVVGHTTQFEPIGPRD